MLSIVSLHCSLERSNSCVNLLINRNIHLGRCSPKNYDTVAVVISLELADISTNLLCHIHAVLTILYVVAIKTLSVVLVECCLERNNLLQFVLYRIDIFFFQYLAVDCRFISVSRINIPCTENDVVKTCDRYDVAVLLVLLVGTLAHANLVILSH